MRPMGNGGHGCPQTHFEQTGLADNYAVRNKMSHTHFVIIIITISHTLRKRPMFPCSFASMT